MKIYRLRMTGDFGNSESMAVWFTNKAEEQARRRYLLDACHDVEAVPYPAIEEFDIPTTRAALVAFLNAECAR